MTFLRSMSECDLGDAGCFALRAKSCVGLPMRSGSRLLAVNSPAGEQPFRLRT